MQTATIPRIRKGVSTAVDPVTAAAELYEAIYQPDTSLALFFSSHRYEAAVLGRALKEKFAGINLVGCTTAGEITPQGYLDGSLTGVSFAAQDFAVASRRIEGLSEFSLINAERASQGALQELSNAGVTPLGKNTFAFLLIDGLSCQEEAAVSALYQCSPNIQLFGGSAGDGTDFGETLVYHDGAFHRDSAVVSFIHTEFPFRVFKTQHFVSSEAKMVVTAARPDRRTVSEINGASAGREYARLVGLDVDELTPMIFASYPVVVKIGGEYYVRSIQKVNADESLTFFCAIEEGLVLTVARGVDIIENLQGRFCKLEEEIGSPELVIGCDCILRKLELDEKGIRNEAGRIFAENNAVGFNTYGEQYNAMHVNQTLTGVAIGAQR